MNTLHTNENQYIAFESQEYMFAVPIEKIGWLIPVTDDMPYVIPPHIPNQVMCVINPYGECITLIDLPKLMVGMSVQEASKIIVTLVHDRKQIAVLAKSVHKITAYTEELSENEATCTKIFTRNGTQYFVLDIPRLYKYLCA